MNVGTKYLNKKDTNMPKKQQWVVISDDKVRHIWTCPDCAAKSFVIPEWYTNNGTPTCECGTDMRYKKTEIRK